MVAGGVRFVAGLVPVLVAVPVVRVNRRVGAVPVVRLEREVRRDPRDLQTERDQRDAPDPSPCLASNRHRVCAERRAQRVGGRRDAPQA